MSFVNVYGQKITSVLVKCLTISKINEKLAKYKFAKITPIIVNQNGVRKQETSRIYLVFTKIGPGHLSKMSVRYK